MLLHRRKDHLRSRTPLIVVGDVQPQHLAIGIHEHGGWHRQCFDLVSGITRVGPLVAQSERVGPRERSRNGPDSLALLLDIAWSYRSWSRKPGLFFLHADARPDLGKDGRELLLEPVPTETRIR